MVYKTFKVNSNKITKNSRINVKKTLKNLIPFSKFEVSSHVNNMENYTLYISISFIKQSSCGFHNLESNCYVDSANTIININFSSPKIISPQNNFITGEHIVYFDVEDTYGIKNYYYRNVNYDLGTITDQNFVVLSEFGTYEWGAVNVFGKWSDLYTFTYTDMEKPTLISPENNSIIRNNNVQLIANDNSQIKGFYYKAENDNEYTFTESHQLENLIDETNYTWYAIDIYDNCSDIFTFRYESYDTSSPMIIYPSQNQTITSLPLTLSASDNKEIKGYYYKSENDTDYIFTSTGILTELDDETNYTWYAIDTSDNVSETYTFYVYLDDVTPPVLISPVNNTSTTSKLCV